MCPQVVSFNFEIFKVGVSGCAARIVHFVRVVEKRTQGTDIPAVKGAVEAMQVVVGGSGREMIDNVSPPGPARSTIFPCQPSNTAYVPFTAGATNQDRRMRQPPVKSIASFAFRKPSALSGGAVFNLT
jgi:hypothetical protein